MSNPTNLNVTNIVTLTLTGGIEVFGDTQFEVTVKSEYLQGLPSGVNPEDIKLYKHLNEHKLQNFIHNDTGPALKCIKYPKPEHMDKFNLFALDGKLLHPLNEEDAKMIEVIKHKTKFNGKMDQVING